MGRCRQHVRVQDRRHAEAVGRAAGRDGLLDLGERLLRQQLQDAHEVTPPRRGAVLFLQGLAQFGEHGRQFPVTEDVGVIQRRRPAPQRGQVVQRFHHPGPGLIRAGMAGDLLVAGHHDHGIDIALDRHGLKGKGTRHAVAVVVEAHRLVLVHLGWLTEAGVEGLRRQGQGLDPLVGEELADGFALVGLGAILIPQGALAQVSV